MAAPIATRRCQPSISTTRPVPEDLAATVLDSEASFGLLGGYAGWDGAEPQPPEDSEGRRFRPQGGELGRPQRPQGRT